MVIKKISSLKSRVDSLSLFSIFEWLHREHRSLTEGGPAPELELIVSGFPGASIVDDAVALTIKEGHGPRLFDPAIGVFLSLATAFSGTVTLNPVRSNAEGERWYPRVKVTVERDENGKLVPESFAVDRLTVDAKPGDSTNRASDAYRDCRARNLKLEAATSRALGSKFVLGRKEAVPAILRSYDFASIKQRRMPLSRQTFEMLLLLCFEVHDLRRNIDLNQEVSLAAE